MSESSSHAAPVRPWLAFNRREVSGAFGDIGTDLPLLIAMIPAAGLDAAAVFAVFGLMQVLSGLVYGLPMPMQPLKAMAVIVIAGGIGAPTLLGAGLAIGIVMLALGLSGALTVLARAIPHAVVRGIQLGLALSLASLALRTYVPHDGTWGYALAGVCLVLILVLRGNKRVPPALPVIGLGVVVALWWGVDTRAIADSVGLRLPDLLPAPSWGDIATGFVVLALPQIPLSLSNSVIATHKTLGDFFPHRNISVRKLGITYGIANVLVPFLGGVPVCHGCGGLAGHHAFGARTGGSVVIYGCLFLAIGLFLSGAASEVVRLFPFPVLGAILLVEALALAVLIGDVAGSKRDLGVALLVAVIAANVPQGYVIGLLVGTALWYAIRRKG